MKVVTKTKGERFELRLDQAVLERIDDWRSWRPDVPSRSEAVRQLVDAGLGNPEHMRLFQLARFNLLCAAMSRDTAGAVTDAYAYAWGDSVYPLFDDGPSLHLPFAEQFDVTYEMVDELSKYLDERWSERDVPSFYKLEDHYKVQSGRNRWNRSALLHVCRYLFLKDSFDTEFWKALLIENDHPTEAKWIVRSFDRARDIQIILR